MNKNELDPLYQSVKGFCITEEAARNLVKFINARDKEIDRQYDDIFKWLLGENGDFLQSEPGKRYNWRSELRKRLQALKQPKEDLNEQ